MNGYPVQQSTTTQGLRFMLVSSSDHITPVTGATPTVTLCKQGQTSFSAPAGAVSELGNGWYHVAGNATDNNTLGPLTLHATASGADPTDWQYQVVGYNPLSTSNLGLSALPTAAPGANGGLPVGDAAGKVSAKLASTDVTGNLPANVLQIATQTANASGPVTFPGTLASTTNITAATGVTLAAGTHTGAVIPTVTTTTNLTNLPAITANWLTAAGLDSTAATEIAVALVDMARAGHTTTGTFGESFAEIMNAATATEAASAVWDLATSGHTTTGTFGAVVAAGSVDTSAIANAVVDKALVGHTNLGTVGGALAYLDATISSRLAASGYTVPPTVSQIATAVWAVLVDGNAIWKLIGWIASESIGKVSGAPDGPINFAAVGGTSTRISATVTPSGNRQSITLTDPVLG